MWVFYNFTAVEGGVLDVRRINDNFIAMARLQAAGLGEHIWSQGFVDSADRTETGIALRHRGIAREANPMALAAYQFIEISTTWQPADDTFYQRTFESRGGMVYVEVSFCWGSNPNLTGQDPGINFAIRVDGSVMNDTLIGSGDVGGDDIRAGTGLRNSPGSGVSGTWLPDGNGYGPGVRAGRMSFVLTWMGRLPEGRHTVELVYRHPVPADEQGLQFFLNGEINVLEMWA